MAQASQARLAPFKRLCLQPIRQATAFWSRLTCLLPPNCEPACMERLSLPTARGKRYSFRAPQWLCAARWPVCTFSTARELHNFATSHLALNKAISSKFCRVSLRVKSWLTRRPTATWWVSALRRSHEARTWNRRAPGSNISQLQTHRALHRRIARPGNLLGGYHPTRRGAADSCSHAGYCNLDAWRISGRGGRARNAPHRKSGPSDLGRRVCVLDFGAGAELGHRTLSGRHAAGRCADRS